MILRTVQFMNVANTIEHFTIMRIRKEQSLILNVILFEHFVRIELEHFLSMRVHESNSFMIPRSKSSKCSIIYSNDDLLQDTLSIDFEILHATLFGITI